MPSLPLPATLNLQARASHFNSVPAPTAPRVWNTAPEGDVEEENEESRGHSSAAKTAHKKRKARDDEGTPRAKRPRLEGTPTRDCAARRANKTPSRSPALSLAAQTIAAAAAAAATQGLPNVAQGSQAENANEPENPPSDTEEVYEHIMDRARRRRKSLTSGDISERSSPGELDTAIIDNPSGDEADDNILPSIETDDDHLKQLDEANLSFRRTLLAEMDRRIEAEDGERQMRRERDEADERIVELLDELQEHKKMIKGLRRTIKRLRAAAPVRSAPAPTPGRERPTRKRQAPTRYKPEAW